MDVECLRRSKDIHGNGLKNPSVKLELNVPVIFIYFVYVGVLCLLLLLDLAQMAAFVSVCIHAKNR